MRPYHGEHKGEESRRRKCSRSEPIREGQKKKKNLVKNAMKPKIV